MRWLSCVLVVSLCLSAQTPDTAILVRDAVAAHKRGDFETAISKYQQLLRIQPSLVKIRTNLAAALAQTGRLDDAIQVLKEAPAADRDNPAIWRSLALAYYQKHYVPAAAGQLEKLHTADPSDLDVTTMLADCYTQAGQPLKAVQLLTPVA